MSTEPINKIIYGPVPSWRLGRSLGVDPVSQAEKTCSFNCAYCQLGPTRHHTAERKEFIPLSRMVKEMEELPPVGLDYVTFSGTAEPTLASNLGEAILAVKERIEAPVAVLTNSSLMPDPQMRRELSFADTVVAKLDAPTEELFQAVNRPVKGITLASIIEAIKSFQSEYPGRLALQMMFFDVNRQAAAELAELARQIGAKEIQINTPLRPCAVKPLSPEELAPIVAEFAGLPVVSVYEAKRPAVKPLDEGETLRRRPVL